MQDQHQSLSEASEANVIQNLFEQKPVQDRDLQFHDLSRGF